MFDIKEQLKKIKKIANKTIELYGIIFEFKKEIIKIIELEKEKEKFFRMADILSKKGINNGTKKTE